MRPPYFDITIGPLDADEWSKRHAEDVWPITLFGDYARILFDFLTGYLASDKAPGVLAMFLKKMELDCTEEEFLAHWVIYEVEWPAPGSVDAFLS